MLHGFHRTPCGLFEFLIDGGAAIRAGFVEEASASDGDTPSDADTALAEKITFQLRRFFAREPVEFEIPVRVKGTPFQEAVWEEIRRIPRGETATYRELAGRLGRPRAARAVGGAAGANPVALLIPCHRVVGAGGALTGYAGGLERKRFLLGLEGSDVAPAAGQERRTRSRRN